MTWMLTASGRTDMGNWHETERKLVAELQAVLSKPEYKALSSWFRGMHISTSAVHEPAKRPIATADDAVKD